MFKKVLYKTQLNRLAGYRVHIIRTKDPEFNTQDGIGHIIANKLASVATPLFEDVFFRRNNAEMDQSTRYTL